MAATLHSLLESTYKTKRVTVAWLLADGQHLATGTVKSTGIDYVIIQLDGQETLRVIPFSALAWLTPV